MVSNQKNRAFFCCGNVPFRLHLSVSAPESSCIGGRNYMCGMIQPASVWDIHGKVLHVFRELYFFIYFATQNTINHANERDKQLFPPH